MTRVLWRRRAHKESDALPAHLHALAEAIHAAYAVQDAPLASRLATLDTLSDAAAASAPPAKRAAFADVVHSA